MLHARLAGIHEGMSESQAAAILKAPVEQTEYFGRAILMPEYDVPLFDLIGLRRDTELGPHVVQIESGKVTRVYQTNFIE